ncbi:MAG: FAD-dependent oxidoreductase, partial [Deinococcus-Thermus bacterium]|nr:FAD-dependent oxidoreductase [Deinococcota bacterium]
AERAERPDEARAQATEARVRRFLPGVGGRVDAALCLYTKSPDADFVIGAHPRLPAAVVAGGMSGHGFKFGPALGTMLADLALDGASAWWSPRFAPERFAPDGFAVRSTPDDSHGG